MINSRLLLIPIKRISPRSQFNYCYKSYSHIHLNAKRNTSTKQNECDHDINPKEKLKEDDTSFIEGLKETLALKSKEADNLKKRLTKTLVDFANLQSTTAIEIQKCKDFALQKIAKDLLGSLDNIEYALKSVKIENLEKEGTLKDFYKGVSMTKEVLEKTLSKHGIVKHNPEGMKFDPEQHEAVFEVEENTKEPGTIVFVQQIGYSLNSRILRPSKVGIVKNSLKKV